MSVSGLDTVSSPAFTDEDSARFRAAGWWSDATLSDAVRRNAQSSYFGWALQALAVSVPTSASESGTRTSGTSCPAVVQAPERPARA